MVAVIRQIYEDAEALNNAGVSYQEEDNNVDAIAYYQQAIAMQPNYIEAHYNLGNALYADGNLSDAITVYQNALAYRPDFAEVYNNLGGALTGLGRLAEAIGCYRQAISLKADYVDASDNLANIIETVFLQFSDPMGATLELAESCFELGRSLQDSNMLEDAIGAYQKVLLLKPDHIMASYNLGNVYLSEGKTEVALILYQHVRHLNFSDAEFYNNFGAALQKCGRADEAMVFFQNALALQSNYFAAINNLAVTLNHMEMFAEAEKYFRQLLQLKPDCVETKKNLGNACLAQGKSRQAISCYQQVLTQQPDNEVTHRNLIFAMSTDPDSDIKSQQLQRKHWARIHADQYTKYIKPYTNKPESERPLRIGYVSADFRLHAVAFMIAPMLNCYDRNKFEVVCYADVECEDSITEIFKQSASQWRYTVGMSDDALAEQIRSDQIDILVDLSGNTAGNRLFVFARKPAPIQVTAWGDATGTGLTTMDYLFNDEISVPQDEAKLYTEEIAYLPSRVTYMPLLDVPDVQSAPAIDIH